MMRGFVLLSVVFAACQAATVSPPVPVTGADTTSLAPPDLLTNSPETSVPMVTDTSGPMSSTSGPMVPGTSPTVAPDTSASVASVPGVTSEVVSTEMPGEVTNETEPCRPSLAQIQGVFNYTNAPEFKELSENQQIVIYELLAAGEACKLKEFITPATAQRIFLLVEDLPLKYVYLFVSFLARNLEAEGVVVPV